MSAAAACSAAAAALAARSAAEARADLDRLVGCGGDGWAALALVAASHERRESLPLGAVDVVLDRIEAGGAPAVPARGFLAALSADAIAGTVAPPP